LDTHVRAWYPTESYDREARLRLRTNVDFAFISLEGPSSRIDFSVVSRTSNNSITIVAHRLKEPWPAGMTYSIWREIRDDMLDGLLDQVQITDLGRYSVNTFGAQHIMLEAQGPSVGYGIASVDSWADRPTWCLEPATPTPFPSPQVTSTPGAVVNRIEVPPVVASVVLQHALLVEDYVPGTCFEIAADDDGNGRSTTPNFLIVIHMPDGETLRWKFQQFEDGSVYMSPSHRPCDVGVEYLR
jgi:hypothetical protein